MKNTSKVTYPSSEYFQQVRSDVAQLVSHNCHNILEIGCGFGELGRLLVERQSCQIDGVEINPDAEPYLKQVYKRYWIGDIEQIEFDQKQQYDCILLPDVLEHLVDPWALLKRLTAYLYEDGVIIASIPNIRNLGILYRLLVQGRWEYESSGVLDRGHLRFFTRSGIQRLFDDCGLEIDAWKVNRDNYPGIKGLAAGISRLFISDIDICQYLVCARKSKNV
jgi:SAM-dependent methyltransferase